MKLQPDKFSCGVYAVMNAAICLGVRLTPKKVLKYSNTTKKGTSEVGVKNALLGNKLSYKEFTYKDSDLPLNKLKAIIELSSAIANGTPAILCVDKWDHWIVVVGKIGTNYVIFDSDSTRKNIKENGTYVLTIEELTKRWLFNDGYYGIVVSKGEIK